MGLRGAIAIAIAIGMRPRARLLVFRMTVLVLGFGKSVLEFSFFLCFAFFLSWYLREEGGSIGSRWQPRLELPRLSLKLG